MDDPRKFRADLPILLKKSTMLTSASPFLGARTPDRMVDALFSASKNAKSDSRLDDRKDIHRVIGYPR